MVTGYYYGKAKTLRGQAPANSIRLPLHLPCLSPFPPTKTVITMFNCGKVWKLGSHKVVFYEYKQSYIKKRCTSTSTNWI